MESTMDIDELKNAWQTLDQRLDQQQRLNLRLFTESRVATARRHLRPLVWGQWLQIGFGVAMILLGISAWRGNLGVPELFVSGIVLHVYGIALIMFAGIVRSLIGGIDPSAPVVDIQKRLARLHHLHVRSGVALGLAWWLLWIPCGAALLHWLAGVNVFRAQPAVFGWMLASGVAGIIASVLFHRWASDPRRPRLARFVNDNLTPASLRKARFDIDEIADFERP